MGLIPACLEFVPQTREKLGQARCLNVGKGLSVDAGGTVVPLGLTIGLQEGLGLGNVHKETPEAMRLVRLRLPVYPPPQFLQTNGRLCHLTPASRCSAEYPPVRALPSRRVLLHADHQYYNPIRLPGAC